MCVRWIVISVDLRGSTSERFAFFVLAYVRNYSPWNQDEITSGTLALKGGFGLFFAVLLLVFRANRLYNCMWRFLREITQKMAKNVNYRRFIDTNLPL